MSFKIFPENHSVNFYKQDFTIAAILNNKPLQSVSDKDSMYLGVCTTQQQMGPRIYTAYDKQGKEMCR